MTVRIRQLGTGDWKVWREMRLRALTDSPDAFGRTVDEERQRADDDWRTRLSRTDSAFLAAERGDEPLGIAAVWMDPSTSSLATVFSMWVVPDARRQGVARALLDHAIGWAGGQGAATVRLTVTEGNIGAYELYRRAGFAETGEREPLREGSPLQTLWMSRQVRP